MLWSGEPNSEAFLTQSNLFVIGPTNSEVWIWVNEIFIDIEVHAQCHYFEMHGGLVIFQRKMPMKRICKSDCK